MTGPSWKHRRRLIYTTFGLGVAMILVAVITIGWDTQIGVQLVIGGVALISIILTAYTGFATYEDVKIWKEEGDKTSDG
jgi:hypothetical protein